MQRTVLGMALVFGAMACHVDQLSLDRLQDNPENFFWRARLNHHAITLSTFTPWDTVRLSMIPLTYRGDTLRSDEARTVFESADSNLVSVSSVGQVRAKKATGGVQIFARTTIGNITYADTALVKVEVNPAPSTLGSFVFQARSPDSAKVAVNIDPFFLSSYVEALSTVNAPMTEILVHYESLDPVRLRPDGTTGALPSTFVRPIGTFAFVASTYAYGVAKSDTLQFVIGHSLSWQATFSTQARADSLGTETTVGLLTTLGVGGEMFFFNSTAQEIDLVFEDTTHIQVSIPLFENESVNRILGPATEENPDFTTTMAYRRFTAPGIYKFRDRISGLKGEIHVIAE